MIAQECLAKFADVILKIFALTSFSFLNKPLRAGRVIQIENRRLNESVRGARRGGMQRIALELDRPPVHGRGDKGNAARAPRHCGRVVEEFSGDSPFDVLGKRNQMHFRPATTR